LAFGSFCAFALKAKRTTIKRENNFFIEFDLVDLNGGKDRF
jgi:hypothetical protein